ncbi:hypothetical protein QBC45DRAFT_338605, partial [Copromyces sp. CBS 386.78]
NYGLEIFYVVWLLYLDIVDFNIREVILKGGLVCYIIVRSGYKFINLFNKYFNFDYILDIKYNNNLIYDLYSIFIRLFFNGNYLDTIRKIIEKVFRRVVKGIYIVGDIIIEKLYSHGDKTLFARGSTLVF